MSALQVDATLAALADPARRAVVDLLSRKPRRAGELADELSLSAARMSQHLRVLRHCGLIAEETLRDDARIRLYRLRPEQFAGLRDWLDDVQSFWSSQLSAFKAHAERTRGKRRA
jgi:DNA-binding transcriptional ArsR family regulator